MIQPLNPSVVVLDPSVRRKATRSAVALTALNLLVAAVVGMTASRFTTPMNASFVALVVMSVLTTVAVSLLGLWGDVGLNRPHAWRTWPLLAVPAVVVLVLPFLHGFKVQSVGMVVMLAAGYGLTGWYEELWSRGLLFRILSPAGVRRAVIVSSVLFAVLHLGSVVYRDPAVVLAQMVGAFCSGLAYATLRVRTRSLWPAMLLHALQDFTLHCSAFPVIPLNVAQDVVLLVYALVLLRGQQEAIGSVEGQASGALGVQV